MKETSSIRLTDKQLLLEERAGKPLREVLVEAYDASSGSMKDAARWILDHHGVSVSESRFHGWARQVGLKRALQPAEEAQPAGAS